MQGLLDQGGLDTALARRLLDQGHLDVDTLQALLAEARGARPEGGTLARSLLARGLVPQPVLEEVLENLEARGWRVGARVDDYRLLDRLGAGGMGVVFLAEHTQTRGRYALKTLPASSDPDLLERFRREAEAQAKVDSHPNVVRVHSFGQAFGHLYLVMDHAQGGDLEGQLRIGPFQDPRQAATVVRDLARGLAHVHAAGVLHRDLKPANVLFDDQKTAKLVDFGLARASWEGGSLTQSGDLMGTPAYMAPEQARADRGAVDERTDVYGLGAIFYQCLTGQVPFKKPTVLATLAEVAEGRLPPPSKLRPGLPQALESICLRAMAREPADRYASASDLADDLNRYLLGDSVEGLAARRLLPLALAAGVVVLASVLAAVFWPTDRIAAPPTRTPVDTPAKPPPPPKVSIADLLALLGQDAPQRKRAIERLEGEEGRRLSPEQHAELKRSITALLLETETRRTGLAGAMVEVDLHLALVALDPDHFAGPRVKVWIKSAPADLWTDPALESFVRDLLFVQPGSIEVTQYRGSFRREKHIQEIDQALARLPANDPEVERLRRQKEEHAAAIADRVPYLWRLVPRLRAEAFAARADSEDTPEKSAGELLGSVLDRLRRDLQFLEDQEGLERLLDLVHSRRSEFSADRLHNLQVLGNGSLCSAILGRAMKIEDPIALRLELDTLLPVARRGLALDPANLELLGFALTGVSPEAAPARAAARRAFLKASAGANLTRANIGNLHWESVAQEEVVAILSGQGPDGAAAAVVLWPLPRASGKFVVGPVLDGAPAAEDGTRPLRVRPALLVRIVRILADHRPDVLAEAVQHIEWSHDTREGWNNEAGFIVPVLSTSLERGGGALESNLEHLAKRLPLED